MEAAVLGTGIAPYCIVFRGPDMYTALGITIVFWSIFFLHSLLNGTCESSYANLVLKTCLTSCPHCGFCLDCHLRTECWIISRLLILSMHALAGGLQQINGF
jgi:hypothetical protein